MTAPISSQTTIPELLRAAPPRTPTLLQQSGPALPTLLRETGITRAAADATFAPPAGPPETSPQLSIIAQAVKGAAVRLRDGLEGLVRLPEFAGRNIGAFIGTKILGDPSFADEFISEEERKKAREGAAIGLSLAVGGATTALLKPIIAAGGSTIPTVAGTFGAAPEILGSAAAGATFGATRERGEDESLAEAIAIDAVLFGGLHLAGSLVAQATKPLRLSAAANADVLGDLVLGGTEAQLFATRTAQRELAAVEMEFIQRAQKAGLRGSLPERLLERQPPAAPLARVQAARQRLSDATRFGEDINAGRALYEEMADIGETLNAKALPGTEVEVLADMPVSVMRSPNNIGFMRNWFGSPSKWHTVGGPVGEAANRIAWNGIERMRTARRISVEQQAVRVAASKALFRGTVRPAKRAALKQQLAKLLDNVFDPSDLPVTIPANVREAFTLMRGNFLGNRETLRLLQGGSADWGINAYLPHVFVGDYVMKNAADDATLAILRAGDIRKRAAELLAERPSLQLKVEPRAFQIPAELRGLGITGQRFARFTSQAGKALSLGPEEVAELVMNGRILRVAPGKKFFGHTAQREANLSGFLMDPFEAHAIYSAGFARKVAFHDFRQKATAITEVLAREQGTQPSVRVLERYIDDVMGVSGPIEESIRATMQALTKTPGVRSLPPRTIEFLERALDPRILSARINFFEAISRLGLSPTAWFVNLTQTAINTAGKIGWGPTMKGIRLLNDRSQRETVEKLLRAMDIDIAIPLTAADQMVRRHVGETSVFHPLYLFQRVETFNRSAAGLAKYQQMIEQGASAADALFAAKRFITKTQFEYSLADTPALMRGPLGATAFQFKKFVTKELEFFWGLRNDPAALLRAAIGVQVIGGLSAIMNLPPFSLVDWVVGKATGETLVERAQRVAPRASRGIPGFVGIDLGGNVSVGLPGEVSAREILGPGLQDITTLGRDLLPDWFVQLVKDKNGNLTPQERAKAMAQITPVMIRRLRDAYDVSASGEVRVRGTTDVLFTPEDPAREAVLTAIGARSLDRAEFSRFSMSTERMRAQLIKKETGIVQRWANAYVEGDFAEAERILLQAERDEIVLTERQLADALGDAGIGRALDIIRRLPPELREEALRNAPAVVRRQLNR